MNKGIGDRADVEVFVARRGNDMVWVIFTIVVVQGRRKDLLERLVSIYGGARNIALETI